MRTGQLALRMIRSAYNAVGCKLNQYEMQLLAETLEPYGFLQVPFTEKADLYVINSCTVTSKADSSSRQMIRRALRSNPRARILVTGCYAELEIDSLRELSEDIFIIGNKAKSNIPDMVRDMFGITHQERQNPCLIGRMDGHSRAFVKIQDGCAEKCTYCVIWKARGKPWSRDSGEIIAEINGLYENGYREVVLTGVHIGKYKNDCRLTGLLKVILEHTAMPRIRLSSLKPNECNDELLDIISTQKRICPHIHLPIQSGDDSILRMMGRKYKAAAVRKLVQRLASLREGMTVGADVIVGFPGEDDTAFAYTFSLIEECPIHHLHVFSHSDRPGAPAANLPDKIAPSQIARRSKKLWRLGRLKKTAHMRSFLGRTLDVIVENRGQGSRMMGMSGNYLNVALEGNDGLRGKLVQIRVTGCDKEALIGNVVDAEVSKND